VSKTIATVNGAPIDDKAVGAAMQGLAQEHYHATLEEVEPAAHASLHEMAIERLLARELIFQAAMAEGLLASEEAVEEESTRILRMMGNPQNFWQRLAERGLDEASFLRMVRKDVTVDQMSARKFEEVPEPDEAAINDFFRAHPEKLKGRQRVRVAHILIPYDIEGEDEAMRKCLKLKEKAQAGDFAELAKLHSTCPSAPGGGDLGYIKREDVDADFAEAAFTQVEGEVGPPIKTPYGYHLIKVKDREIPAPPTLEEARPRIIHFLKQAQGAKLLETWVASMKEQAKITFLHD